MRYGLIGGQWKRPSWATFCFGKHQEIIWKKTLFLDLAVAKSLQSTRTVTDADDDDDHV